jgi:hypothetical protein
MADPASIEAPTGSRIAEECDPVTNVPNPLPSDRTAAKAAPGVVRCRYLGKFNRCTAEAVDPVGEVLLCAQHLARAIEFLRSLGMKIQAPAGKAF